MKFVFRIIIQKKKYYLLLSIIKKKLDINFKKNTKNLGFGSNFYKVVKMAKGEFIWVIGNDDLLYIDAFKKLDKLFSKNKDVDFFFINSSSLNSKFVFNHKQPFNTNSFAQNAALLALKDYRFIRQSKKNNDIAMNKLIDLFNTLSSRA